MPGKPGTGKPATAGKPAPPVPPPSDPELVVKLEEQLAALGVAQAQLAR